MLCDIQHISHVWKRTVAKCYVTYNIYLTCGRGPQPNGIWHISYMGKRAVAKCSITSCIGVEGVPAATRCWQGGDVTIQEVRLSHIIIRQSQLSYKYSKRATVKWVHVINSAGCTLYFQFAQLRHAPPRHFSGKMFMQSHQCHCST